MLEVYICKPWKYNRCKHNSINKQDADDAFDAATYWLWLLVWRSCKNSSAMLFVSAKVSQYALLPQGRIEADRVIKHGKTNGCRRLVTVLTQRACEVECPKGISLENIARMNREY
jgi:succinate dehydrogenase / fumarate reductase iron-sulfur subunit